MTFERWLQTRLNAHGAKLAVDGDIGRATIAAIKKFQSANGIIPAGVANSSTVEALRRQPGATGKVAGEPAAPAATLPPWMYELVRRMGLHEVRDKAELVSFLKIGKFLGDPAKLPWCFRGDVEILTEEGWQRFDELTAGRVYQASADGELSLTEYIPVVKDYVGDLDVVTHQSFTLRADPDHRWWGSLGREGSALVRRDNQFCRLSEMKTEGLSIPSVHAGGVGCGLDEKRLRLVAAILSDGTIKRREDGTPREICIAVSRQHKIDALHGLSPSHHYVQKEAYGPLTTKPMDIFTFRFDGWMHAVITPNKELDRDFINSMSQGDARSFLDAYRMFDGSQSRFHLYTSSEQRRDDLMQIAVMAGWFAGVTTKTGGFGDRPCYEIHVKTRHEHQHISPENISREFFAGKLYCVTVPEHRIVVRERGRGAVVTGNCGDAVESAFAKTLPDERLPTNAFFAQNWATFGKKVEPMVGAVGVIRWSAGAGHVGFVSRVSASTISLVGGNQTNAVTNASFPRSKFIAFRWPLTFPVRAYPTFTGATIDGGGVVATR